MPKIAPHPTDPTKTGPGYRGSGAGEYGNQRNIGNTPDTTKSAKSIVDSAAGVAYEWSQLQAMGVGTNNSWITWESQMAPQLALTLQGESNMAQAQQQLGYLMATGKVNSAASLAQWENSWNLIQTHAKDHSSAESLMQTMIQDGYKNTTGNVTQFISAWDTLVNEGINPASISAQDIANQIAMADATAKLMNPALEGAMAVINASTLATEHSLDRNPALGPATGNTGINSNDPAAAQYAPGSGSWNITHNHNNKVEVTNAGATAAEIGAELAWLAKYGQ
jgi:hypothetical protein